eukprot:4832625-Pleurochrysis_carterae.AAC.1
MWLTALEFFESAASFVFGCDRRLRTLEIIIEGVSKAKLTARAHQAALDIVRIRHIRSLSACSLWPSRQWRTILDTQPRS